MVFLVPYRNKERKQCKEYKLYSCIKKRLKENKKRIICVKKLKKIEKVENTFKLNIFFLLVCIYLYLPLCFRFMLIIFTARLKSFHKFVMPCHSICMICMLKQPFVVTFNRIRSRILLRIKRRR